VAQIVSNLDPKAEAALRLLRTVLDEARDMLRLLGTDETQASMLERRIARAQQEAEALVPSFCTGMLRNGASGG